MKHSHLLIISFSLFFGIWCNAIIAQTVYTSSPDVGDYVTCPSNDVTCSSGTYLGNTVRMKTHDINGDVVQFRVKKCVPGTFSSGGIFYIKDDQGECGNILASINYSSGDTYLTVSYTFPSSFTSGTQDYYGVLVSDTGDKFRAGYVSITASSAAPYLEFTSCISAPSSINMYEDLNVTYELTNMGSTTWGVGGWVKTYIAENNNASNAQLLRTNVYFGGLAAGNTSNIDTGNDEITLTPGSYKIVSIYSDAPNGGNDSPVAGSCTPTTTTSSGTITHYQDITINPPCSENASLSVSNPDPGDVFYSNSLQISWSDNVGVDCEVNVYYKIGQNGAWELVNGNAEIPNFGFVNWNFGDISSNYVKVRVELATPTSNDQTILAESGVFSIFNILSAPTQTAPDEGAVFNSGVNTVTFEWNKNNPGGAANYEIRLVDLTDNSSVILDYFDVGDVDHYSYTNTADFIDGHEYQWVVRAINTYDTAEGGFRIFEIGDFGLEHSSPLSFGTSTLIEGQSYPFTTVVTNLGTGDWTGSLYLKINEVNPAQDLGSFTISGGGGTQSISYDFIPGVNHVGINVPVELSYQTNGISDSYVMGSFLHDNPIYVDIIGNGLTLTNPSGGGNYITGQSIDIAWTSTGSINNVSVYLTTISGTTIEDIAINVANSGQIPSWTIPSSVSPGNYNIRICRHPNGPECSELDIPITISNPNSFNLELASGINANPTAPASGQNATITTKVTNAGNLSWNGMLEMALFDSEDVFITSLDLQNNLTINAGDTMSLIRPDGPITSPAGSYKIYVRWRATASDPWQNVNSTNFLNPKNLTILDASGTCFINNPNSEQLESYQAAQFLCANAVIDQPADGDIDPTDLIIKEDLAKVVFICLYNFDPNASTYADNFPVPFGDMQDQENQAYARYGKVLSYLEYGDGISPFYRKFFNYRPGSYITRGQVCKVLMEAFNLPKDQTFNPFDDVPGNHPEYLHIAKCADLGIVSNEQTNFRPDDFATREEVFIMLHRLMAICPTCPSFSIPVDDDFFDPGNFTPANLSNHPSISDANFDQYSKRSFFIPGRNLPLVFEHSYNSYLTELPDQLFEVWDEPTMQWTSFRPLGHGWSHSYNSYIVKIPGWSHNGMNQDDRWAVVWPSGSIHVYDDNGANPTAVTEGLYDDVTYNASSETFTITKKDQVVFTYEKLNTANDDWPYVLTEIKDRNNNKVQLNYEPFSGGGLRVKEVVGTAGRKLTFTYYGNTEKIYQVKDPLNRIIQFSFTQDDLLTYRFYEGNDPLETVYNYSNTPMEAHLLKVITLPNGNFTSNVYEERKLKSSITNNSSGGGSVTEQQIAWNLNGTPSGGTSSNVTIMDGGNTYDYTYNTTALGRIKDLTTPTNSLDDTKYEDPDNPLLPTSVTIDGITTNYTYDNNGNVLTVIQAVGTSVQTTHSFAYTSINDISSYTNPRNNTTTFSYTSGNLSTIAAPIGSSSMTYNPYGQIKTVTNPESLTVTYDHDVYGNVTQVTGPMGITSNAEYDIIGRIENSTNPNNQMTTFEYYDRDFIKKVTNPMSYTTEYDYDDNGNLTDITNAKGKTTHLEYSYFDWLESVEFEGDKKEYFYDDDGKLNRIKKPSGKNLYYSYDNDGNLFSNGYATFTYDNKNRVETVLKDGKSITFTYDLLHRITSVNYDNKTVSYDYDANSNIKKVTYPFNKVVDYTYDANDRLKTVKDWHNQTTTYTYLSDGRLSNTTYPNGIITTNFYDNAGRLDSISTMNGSTVICAYQFTLDPIGNHLSESKTEPFDEPVLAAQNKTITYNDDNTIITYDGKSYVFDDNGNLTSQTGRNLTWDDHDMLTGVSGDIEATYEYDGLGNRRKATIDNNTRKFVLSILGMSQVLMETEENGEAINYYVYGIGLISRIKPDGSTRYYHGDFRGSTIAMTDESADITHQYQYDAFGLVFQETEEDENPFKFVGMHGVMEDTPDLIFMRARYYDPIIGRFLSEDPVWNENLYSYGGEEPIGNIDADGRKEKSLQGFSVSISNMQRGSKYKNAMEGYELLGTAKFAFEAAAIVKSQDEEALIEFVGDEVVEEIISVGYDGTMTQMMTSPAAPVAVVLRIPIVKDVVIGGGKIIGDNVGPWVDRQVDYLMSETGIKQALLNKYKEHPVVKRQAPITEKIYNGEMTCAPGKTVTTDNDLIIMTIYEN